MLAGRLRRLGAPRVDDVDLAAARDDALQPLRGVRNLQEAPLGDDRIGADDDQATYVVDVRKRLRERKPVHLGRDGELVCTVLRRRRVHALRAEAGHEALREDRVQDAETRRRSDVHRDRRMRWIGGGFCRSIVEVKANFFNFFFLFKWIFISFDF